MAAWRDAARRCLALGLGLLWVSSLPAQDTIFFRGDTIRVGALEWDMEKDWRSRRPLLSSNPELYGADIRILLEYHRNHSVEVIQFGYEAEDTGFVPHGPARYYYDSGHLLGKRRFVAGRLQGPAADYHKNGQLKLQTNYAQDTLQGAFTTYYENGVREAACTYRAGEVQGAYRAWYSNGQPRWTEQWQDGRRVGPDTTFFETGTVERILSYQAGQLHGRALYFHRNGRAWAERIYADGLLRTVTFVKSKEGLPLDIGAFEDGDGWLWIYNDEGLPIERERYRDGLLKRVKPVKD
jgi:antitoxin component YwqK of YwqJK toxin-antitoxin module